MRAGGGCLRIFQTTFITRPYGDVMGGRKYMNTGKFEMDVFLSLMEAASYLMDVWVIVLKFSLFSLAIATVTIKRDSRILKEVVSVLRFAYGFFHKMQLPRRGH